MSFLAILTASLRLPALNAGTLEAAILISSICGLRPLRAARSRTSSYRNRSIELFHQLPKEHSVTAANTASTAAALNLYSRSGKSFTASSDQILFVCHVNKSSSNF